MSALIGALRVSLSADTAAFNSGMAKAEKRATTGAQRIARSFGNVTSAAAAMVTGLGLAGLAASAKQALDYAASIGEVSTALGVTSRDLQLFRGIATQVGATQEEMEKSLAKLTVTLGKAATGSEKEIETFKALGFNMDAVKAGTVSASDAMLTIADAMQKIQSPTQRAAVLVGLFGKSGQKMATLLGNGSGDIRKYFDEMERGGHVLSDEAIQKADETADKIAQLTYEMKQDFSSAVANNAESILGLAKALQQLTVDAVNFINKNPQLVSALTGAAMGARFGLPGAAAGGVAGFVVGTKIKNAQDDASSDIGTRTDALQAARVRMRGAQKNANSPAGKRYFNETVAEVKNQTAKLLAAKGLGPKPVVSPTAVVAGGASAVSGLNASGGGGGSKGKSSAQLEKDRARELERAADNLRHYTDEEAANQADIMALEAEIADTYSAKVAAEVYQIEVDRQANERSIQASDDLTEAQKQTLIVQNDKLAASRTALVNQQEADRTAEVAREVEQSRYDLAIELLGFDANQARTAKQRRDIELRILDLAIQQERSKLEGVLATKEATSAEYQYAQARLAQLGALKAGQAASISDNNMGPMASYLDSLPQTADELNEALEGVAANGLQSVTDGLAEAVMNFDNLGDIARQVLQQILSDLIRVQIQAAVGSSASGGGGGLLGGILNAVGGAFGGSTTGASPISMGQTLSDLPFSGSGLPGFATGGSMRIGGNAGYDTNLLSINGSPVARVSKGEAMHIVPDGGRSNGDNYSIAVNVPSTGDDRRDRRSGQQAAAAFRSEITRFNKMGG